LAKVGLRGGAAGRLLADRICNTMLDRSLPEPGRPIRLLLSSHCRAAARGRTSGRWQSRLFGAEKPLRLEQLQRRHGDILPLQTRTGLRFKKGTAPHVNSFGLGETGRPCSNVWDYPGVSSVGPSRMEELAMHPTDGLTAWPPASTPLEHTVGASDADR